MVDTELALTQSFRPMTWRGNLFVPEVTIRISAAMVLLAGVAASGPAFAGSCAEKVVASSPFTSSPQGWSSNTPAEITWAARGGNAGGYLKFTDATAGTTYVDAPAAYLGSYAALNNAGYIAYDHKITSETDVTSYSPYEIRLSGPGGAAKFDGSVPNAASTGWLTVVAPLVAADWTLTSGTWADLLNDVTDLQIDVELVTNQTIPGDTDIEGLDNVILVSRPCGFGKVATPP